MGLNKELWTGELIKGFRHAADFLSRVPSADQFVENDAIHLADMGVDPVVLINNTTYPINSAQRTDEDVILSLDKYDTENTIITDDELYSLPYDKKGSVLNQHRETLEEKTAQKSMHALCPSANTADTPVIMTSGDSNGETEPRKKLIVDDIIKLKRAMDLLGIPATDRELVLNPWHVADLLLASEAFKNQWKDIAAGTVLNMFGFNISEMNYYPVFSSTNSQKKAFGAAAAPSTDLPASIAFYNRRAVKARGSVSMYYKEASTDPKYRQSEVGFRLYHICVPKLVKGFCSIVSATVS